MKLILLGSLAAVSYASVPFGGQAFDNFFDNAEARRLDASAETSAEGDFAFEIEAYGACWDLALFMENADTTHALAQAGHATRAKSCEALASECHVLYPLCTKSGNNYCVTDNTTYNKFSPLVLSDTYAAALEDAVKAGKGMEMMPFSSDMCEPCTSLVRESALVAAVMGLTHNDSFTAALMMSGVQLLGQQLAQAELMCKKDNMNGFCGDVISDALSKQSIATEEVAFEEVCMDCGNFTGDCSDPCKAHWVQLKKDFGSCSLSASLLSAFPADMANADMTNLGGCLDANLEDFIDEKCKIVGSKPIKVAAKTVLKVGTTMAVAVKFTPAEETKVKDNFCDLVQSAAATAAGVRDSEILMACSITSTTTRRRLLTTSYQLEAKVQQPQNAADQERSGTKQLPSTFTISTAALAEVTTTLVTEVAEELSIAAPTVTPAATATPTAAEEAEEALAEHTRVAVQKTQLGIVITAAELAALPEEVKTAVQDAIDTTPVVVDSVDAPVAAPVAAAVAPTAATFSAAPVRDAWGVAASLALAAASLAL